MKFFKTLRRLSWSLLVVVMLMTLMIGAAVPALAGDETKEKKGDEMINVLMKTSMGDIVIELNRTKAPVTVDNFLSYVDESFYSGVIFHRIISTFMIQGGGFTADMTQKPTHKPIINEWENGLKNDRGTISMARTSDPNSATCQFFINVVDNPALDQPRGGAAYAVFGKVTKGMEVVDKIKGVKTTSLPNGMRDVPVEPVVIEKVVRIDDKGEEIAPEKKEAPKETE